MTDFNTNIKDYTMDELFKLLSVDITAKSTYDEIKTQIETSTDNFIKQFEILKKPEIVSFFNEVKKSLIGINDTETTSTKNIITYKNVYNPSTSNTQTFDNNIYNQNNGAGNPIHRKTVTKLLNVDSRFRSNYLTTLTTDFLLDLPAIKNVIEMTLSDLEMPTTFYPISESYNNNYFWIHTVDIDMIDSYYYIVIPDGNYYFQTLIDNINAIFKSVDVDLGDLTIKTDLNYANLGGVGEGTGLTTFFISNIDTTIVSFDINFNASPIPNQKSYKFTTDSTINGLPASNYYYTPISNDYKELFGWILGFRKPTYSGISIINEDPLTLYYTSESIIDLTGPKYLFLILDDFNNSKNVNFFTSSVKGLLNDSIIARISQKGALFSIQSQNDFSIYSEPRYYYGPVTINKLRVRLIDEYSRVVNLNNKDFSFTLKITTIYSAT